MEPVVKMRKNGGFAPHYYDCEIIYEDIHQLIEA